MATVRKVGEVAKKPNASSTQTYIHTHTHTYKSRLHFSNMQQELKSTKDVMHPLEYF